MNKTIAVVGAGISGLLLARDLQARGADVVVLEKSRGVGGRLATKLVGPRSLTMARSSSPRRAKSADRIDGAIFTMPAILP